MYGSQRGDRALWVLKLYKVMPSTLTYTLEHGGHPRAWDWSDWL